MFFFLLLFSIKMTKMHKIESFMIYNNAAHYVILCKLGYFVTWVVVLERELIDFVFTTC